MNEMDRKVCYKYEHLWKPIDEKVEYTKKGNEVTFFVTDSALSDYYYSKWQGKKGKEPVLIKGSFKHIASGEDTTKYMGKKDIDRTIKRHLRIVKKCKL